MTEIRPMIRLQGLPAAPGIAIGQAVVIANRALDVFRIPIAADETDAEVSRFKSACSVTQQQIQGTRAKASHLFGQELAAIFDAHSLLLSDRMFLDQVERRIVEEQVNAEWAVHETSRELAKRFSAIENPYLRERGQDLEDIGRQLLRVLQGIAHHEISDVSGNVILVADDLVPSEAIRLGRDKVIGFAIEAGGRTSHTSIIARSLRLPAVTGLEEVTDYVTNSDPVIVDGRAGIVILHPTPEVLAEYERLRDEISAAGPATPESRESAPVTADGVPVELMVNIDLPEELPQLGRLGARGIGLYRSEFLYMETDPLLPSEEDHLQLYLKLIEAAAPFPAVVRTYDLGGRKLAREMMDSAEENPVLGLRGIRLTLARPQIFRTQIRALLRAADAGDLWIMAPMVSRVEEVEALRGVLAEASAELAREGVPHRAAVRVGIMVEVPAAAIIADSLAKVVDFMAIGTNDLIQYSLAVDRNNRSVAGLYEPVHPAILRMLRFVIESADAAGIPVSLCGEMGADAQLLPLLVGLGLRRVSASPSALPALRQKLAGIRAEEAAKLATACCAVSSGAEVYRLLAERSEAPTGN
ncbi:MAG: phosphoenolpyruvate-protein phosphotransferase system enzyme [Acidobacteriota bacterium]|nr:phosphoenolpyruvate-protein phosphotransferase system enzyme [Acidobacteriota bacterium]